MTYTEREVFTDLANAYRILREAYHHDMHKQPPAANALQIRVAGILARQSTGGDMALP
jgi:hypothetical protein